MTLDIWPLVAAAGLLGVSVLLGGWVSGLASPALGDAGIDGSARRLLLGILWGAILTFGALAALAVLRVDVTALGYAVVALVFTVGLALRPLVADVAHGVALRASHDLERGEQVEVAGESGVVVAVRLAEVVIERSDGARVTVPARIVRRGPIRNFSRTGRRRFEVQRLLPAKADIATMRTRLLGILTAEEQVLEEPAPEVHVSDGDIHGTPLVTLHAWVPTEAYPAVAERLRAEIDRASEHTA